MLVGPRCIAAPSAPRRCGNISVELDSEVLKPSSKAPIAMVRRHLDRVRREDFRLRAFVRQNRLLPYNIF